MKATEEMLFPILVAMRHMVDPTGPAHAASLTPALPAPARGDPPSLPAEAWRKRKDFIAFLEQAAQVADITEVRVGKHRLWVASHPDDGHDILVRREHQFRKYTDREIAALRAGYGLGENVTNTQGPVWARQRKMMMPAYHGHSLEPWVSIIAEEGAALARSWAGPRAVREVLPVTQWVAIQIIVRSMVGNDAQAPLAELHAGATRAMRDAQARSKLPPWVPTPANRRLMGGIAVMDRVLRAAIARRRSWPQPGNDALGLLMQAKDDQGRGFDDTELRDQLVTLVFAGSHTSGATLAWIFHLLATHPEVQAKVASEVDDVLQGHSPTAADIPRLRYTTAMVNEELRLLPTAYVVAREATEPWTSSQGFVAPAGTRVFVPMYVMQRDPRWWDDPDRFAPERWLQDRPASRHRSAYMPFGLGPRTCLGNDFAKMEAILVAATVAQRVHLEPGPEPPERFTGILLEPHGLRLTTTARAA